MYGNNNGKTTKNRNFSKSGSEKETTILYTRMETIVNYDVNKISLTDHIPFTCMCSSLLFANKNCYTVKWMEYFTIPETWKLQINNLI